MSGALDVFEVLLDPDGVDVPAGALQVEGRSAGLLLEEAAGGAGELGGEHEVLAAEDSGVAGEVEDAGDWRFLAVDEKHAKGRINRPFGITPVLADRVDDGMAQLQRGRLECARGLFDRRPDAVHKRLRETLV